MQRIYLARVRTANALVTLGITPELHRSRRCQGSCDGRTGALIMPIGGDRLFLQQTASGMTAAQLRGQDVHRRLTRRQLANDEPGATNQPIAA